MIAGNSFDFIAIRGCHSERGGVEESLAKEVTRDVSTWLDTTKGDRTILAQPLPHCDANKSTGRTNKGRT
jgi:hypothetical protein